MSQHTDEQSLTGDDDSPTAATAHAAAAADRVLDRVLDLDAIMSSARLPERVVRICERADLEADLLDLLDKLGSYVDADGRPLDDDEPSLAEAGVIADLRARIKDVETQMRASESTVRVRGLNEETFSAFERQHRDKDNNVKDSVDYFNRLIVETAIAPKLTIDQVRILRTKLGRASFNRIAVAAFEVCAEGGIDIPKLPSFSRAPKQQEQ